MLKLNLDGIGKYDFSITGVDLNEPSAMFYFNHFLHPLAVWGVQDIEGHLKVLDGSQHHGYEDASIVLGRAYRQALGGKKGIARTWNLKIPFEGNLADVTIDLSGRGYCDLKTEVRDNNLDAMISHVMNSLTREAGIDFYGRTYGKDDHHQIEALGKGFGRAVYYATRILEQYAGKAVSTKGMVD